jgi:sialic acid synthase SpsE
VKLLKAAKCLKLRELFSACERSLAHHINVTHVQAILEAAKSCGSDSLKVAVCSWQALSSQKP